MKEMTIRAKLIWAFGGLTMMVLLSKVAQPYLHTNYKKPEESI